MPITRVHRWIGLLFLLIFAATGLYLLSIQQRLDEGEQAVRYSMRANHVYILFGALLNVVASRLPEPVARSRRAALIGSLMLITGPALVLIAFFIEAPEPAPQRPITTLGVILLFAGALYRGYVERSDPSARSTETSRDASS